MHDTLGDDDHVAPLEQGVGRGVAEPVDLVVPRRVLLDVRVAPGQVRLRLVVVEVADEVLDGVVREELAELAVQLRGERLVVGEDERRLLVLLDRPGQRRRLARPRRAQQRLVADASLEPVDELVDRLGLIARGLERGDESEVGHGLRIIHRSRPRPNGRSIAADRPPSRPTRPNGSARWDQGVIPAGRPPPRDSSPTTDAVRRCPRYVRALIRVHRRARDGEAGQSLVEFSLILMPLFFILLGIIQFGFIFNTYVTMTNAARDAARHGDDLRLHARERRDEGDERPRRGTSRSRPRSWRR